MAGTHGFTPLQALRAATSHAAEPLRQPGLGRIGPGAHADLVAVPGNPLDDIALMEHVDFVMQKGRVRRHDQA
ncbi:amidohydrolase family protein [Streptomyces rubradiris]|uniref:amidohydrolase family protein n=1 Tax=Streptomyces rubradiris TaxID=285531 RepID=UPI0033D13809